MAVSDAKLLISTLLQRFNVSLQSLLQMCDQMNTFVALISALVLETLPVREKWQAIRTKSGSHICTSSLPAAQALSERLVRL